MALLNDQENVDEPQSLSSLLCNEERDFLISQNGEQVAISKLVGKTIALYFSASWCPPCQAFTPILVQAYNELKKRGEVPFEIVLISGDRDENSFEEYYSSMPWLALPYGDIRRRDHLKRLFHVQTIPALIVIGPDGETVTDNARRAVSEHGAKAYPFTDAHLARLHEKRWGWGYWKSCLRNYLWKVPH